MNAGTESLFQYVNASNERSVSDTPKLPRCTSCGAKLGSTRMVGKKCIHCAD